MIAIWGHFCSLEGFKPAASYEILERSEYVVGFDASKKIFSYFLLKWANISFDVVEK